jgi:hypothetical protein
MNRKDNLKIASLKKRTKSFGSFSKEMSIKYSKPDVA